MAGNHTGERKTAAGKNGKRNHAQKPEQKASKKNGQKNGRGKNGKANGVSAAGAPAGTLFIIGGAEDREDTMEILSRLAERIGSGKLVISTLASDHGDELWEVYRKLFT